MINQFGLDRNIPANVKREVRQKCGFGCVICGSGIIQYEHVDPEFHEATSHDPFKIALLCPQCHAKVTTKFWSKEKVKIAMANPICKINGFAKEVFDLGSGHPILRFGGVTLRNCPIPIQVGNIPLFRIEKSEELLSPFRLSGSFYDSNGQLSLEIIDNEWIAKIDNWDVEVSGGKIIIREKIGIIHLKLLSAPPDMLIVEKLDMVLNGIKFEANGDYLKITKPDGNDIELTSCIADNCTIGIEL